MKMPGHQSSLSPPRGSREGPRGAAGGLPPRASSLPAAVPLSCVPHDTRKMGPRRLRLPVSFLAFSVAYCVPGARDSDYDNEAIMSLP